MGVEREGGEGKSGQGEEGSTGSWGSQEGGREDDGVKIMKGGRVKECETWREGE